MKNKKERGASLIDVVSGIIIFTISTGVVISMYYQIYLTMAKTKIHQVAISCMTEVFEKIDLESYDLITTDEVNKLIKESGLNDYFNESKNESTVTCSVTKFKDSAPEGEERLDLVKQINITVKYTVAGKTTTLPINKIKIRE